MFKKSIGLNQTDYINLNQSQTDYYWFEIFQILIGFFLFMFGLDNKNLNQLHEYAHIFKIILYLHKYNYLIILNKILKFIKVFCHKGI